MDDSAKDKIDEHAKIVANTIKACFKDACPIPRELSQQELYNIIKNIGQQSFLQGYMIGLNERKLDEQH